MEGVRAVGVPRERQRPGEAGVVGDQQGLIVGGYPGACLLEQGHGLAQGGRIAKAGAVAGCMVVSGLIRRTSDARLLRDHVVVWTGKLSGLRRFKDDVKEVALPALAHRVVLTPEAWARRVDPVAVVDQAIRQVPAPSWH